MSNESADSGGVTADVPEAVIEWLSSVAAERGVSETELLQALVSGSPATPGHTGVDDAALDRLEREFQSMVDDVRDRIVQVKREADGKAPAEHGHHDLRSAMDQLAGELKGVESQVQQVDDRLAAGFENYEEILTYLTETTDALDRKLGRLAAAVIDLRERVGDTARDEVRRTALAHLTDSANRHGIENANCEDCGESVHVGMLIEPRCPHCDSMFSALEPKTGFFRTSVLHTGTLPALESPPEEPAAAADTLEAIVEQAPGSEGSTDTPSFDTKRVGSAEAPAEASDVDTTTAQADSDAVDSVAGGAERPAAIDDDPADPSAGGPSASAEPADTADTESVGDGVDILQTVDGIGTAYSERLRKAGVDDLLGLAVADPEALGDAIDVPPTTVADWVEQADARTGAS